MSVSDCHPVNATDSDAIILITTCAPPSCRTPAPHDSAGHRPQGPHPGGHQEDRTHWYRLGPARPPTQVQCHWHSGACLHTKDARLHRIALHGATQCTTLAGAGRAAPAAPPPLARAPGDALTPALAAAQVVTDGYPLTNIYGRVDGLPNVYAIDHPLTPVPIKELTYISQPDAKKLVDEALAKAKANAASKTANAGRR